MTKLNVRVIRQLMFSRAFAQVELAHRMGISPRLLDKFLKDEEAPVDYTSNMARALGVPIIEITLA